MIDFENEIVSAVEANVKTLYPSLTVYPEYIRKPPSFPHVTLSEMNNSSYSRSATSGYTDNHVNVLYQLEIYTNHKTNKRSEANAIFKLANETMLGLGFRRISKRPIANLEDSTIYRVVARYEAVVSENGTFHPI